jgi:murein DD-endopeptidase MepM/ murein hydrolase activator NlpD
MPSAPTAHPPTLRTGTAPPRAAARCAIAPPPAALRGGGVTGPRSARLPTLLRRSLASGAVVALVGLAPAVVATAGSAAAPPPPAPAGTYRLPLAGPADLVRGFEPPPQPWAAGHRGVDLRSALGAQALSPVGGVVSFAGPVGGRGVVTVTDAQGRRSSVEPVQPAVRSGDLVAAGQLLGAVTVEGSHCPPGSCLHWGVRVGDEYVDPLALLPGAGPVVLLPLGADDSAGRP